ncbi:MAG TPA: hypothetical protein VK116_05350, partial [Planctomycetota bacterium]|nr:hypothetical protein [Planctomycetota bacterium]
ALADQHFDLFSLMRASKDDDDVSIALMSLVEGEAMAVMMLDSAGAAGGPIEPALASLLPTAKLMASISPMAMLFGTGEAFRRAPLVLRETLVFPYMQGMQFAAMLVANGSWSEMNRAFVDVPMSSEQILHPEKYFDRDEDPPLAIIYPEEGPFDDGWEPYDANVLGELQIEILLRPELGRGESQKVAAGWDGDRYQAYRRVAKDGDAGDEGGGGGEREVAIVWTSVWEDAVEAQEFFRGWVDFAKKRQGLPEDASVAIDDDKQRGRVVWEVGQDARSAIVWDGRQVIWTSGVPASLAEEALVWARSARIAPKRVDIKRLEPKVKFEDRVEEAEGERENEASED